MVHEVGNLLVLDNQVLQHAVLGGDLVHGGEVDLAKLLNVKGTTVLVSLLVCGRSIFQSCRLRTLSVLW
jgi:hypothetical protein